MEKYENLKNYLLKNINKTSEIISMINSIDSSLESLECWSNDQDFFNTYFYNDPMEAVKASYYGDYNYCDKYVAFDGNGNLTSLTENELENEYEEYIDDIIEALLEHYQKIEITDNELIELIEKYIEEVNK